MLRLRLHESRIKNMNGVKNRIKELLLQGKTWSRKELEEYLGVSDRMVRLAIHDLREIDEFPIWSSSNGKGYRMAESAEEYLVFGEREFGSRINSNEKMRNAVRRGAMNHKFPEVRHG